MKKKNLKIGGMSCSACSSGLEKYLQKQDGIISASVNLVLGSALIEYEDFITEEDLTRFIKSAGFTNLGNYEDHVEEKNKKGKIFLVLFGILSLLILYVAMGSMIGLPSIPFLDMEMNSKNYAIFLLLVSLCFLVYGFDIFKNGYKNLIHKTPNMDTLVMVGVLSSFGYSLYETILILQGKMHMVHNLYYESVCLVIYFLKLGRFIENQSKSKTKEAIQDLVQITPSKALLKKGKDTFEVTLDEIQKGDILVCKPGMKVAVDGTIVSGSSHVDEAFITGESLPVKKTSGMKVVAGSMNLDGYLEYQAERIGKDSTISEIVRLVVEATNTKAPISKIADEVSGIFVPTIFVLAFLSFLVFLLFGSGFHTSFTHFVSVLVVACPCALGLATPLAIVVGTGKCAKHGILIKTSETLENTSKIDTIVFDKTGTLTYGNLKLSKVYAFSKSEEELLTLIASLEQHSTHPIAQAFVEYAKEKKYEFKEVTNFENLAGLGLKGTIDGTNYFVGNAKILTENPYQKEEEQLSKEGSSIVYLKTEKEILGLFGVKDIVREDAKETILNLTHRNKEVLLLTGDNELTAQTIAKELGIKEVIAGVLPKEKASKIKELMDQGKKVMMVGDGINDAPSLATATIGMSISSGTDIAGNSANVILMNDHLNTITEFLEIGKDTIKIIKQNLFWAFFYNLCMIPIAAGCFTPFGITMNPMLAGLAMTMSSLTVVCNTLRLKKERKSICLEKK